MWRHGIHAFLEILRYRVPKCLHHMLAFIYVACSTMALLYENVTSFRDTWIECFGDLGRYRMAIDTWIECLGDFGRYRIAIKDDQPGNRKVWSYVTKHWHTKASDRSPSVERLYHHLAMLARPYTSNQLASQIRSLTCVLHSRSARDSIINLFTPKLVSPRLYKCSESETVTAKTHPRSIADIVYFKVLQHTINSACVALDSRLHLSSSSSVRCGTWWQSTSRLSKLRSTTSIQAIRIHFENSSYVFVPSLHRCKNLTEALVSGMMARAVIYSILCQATSASPLTSSRPDTSMIAYTGFVTSLLYLLIAAALLGAVHLIAKAYGPVTINGILMALTSMAWWIMRGDDPTFSVAQWMYALSPRPQNLHLQETI